jgi:putative ABC transport system substrate-binding protein
LLVAVSVFSGGCGKKPQKVYRIGIVSGVDAFVSIADGFKAKMAELGYIEGKNIVYDFHKLNADPAGYDRVCQKFVDDKVDLIFAFPTEPALAAKTAVKGTNIPVVFAHAGLEGSHLVNSIPQPGGNITGTRFPGPDMVVKRFEFLLELAPYAKRLYMPYDKNYPNCAPAMKMLRPVASSKGVTLVELPVTNLAEIQADIETRVKSADIGVDAILLLPEILTQTPDGWAIISKFAAEHKLPLVGSSAVTAERGSIFSYNVDNLETGGLAATIVDKILKGAPAGTIMVVTPPSHLRINYKVAKELGLTVPEGLLNRADEIIR